MKFLNQTGSSLLQVIIIGSVLSGLGVYLMQTSQQQNKIVKSAEAKGAYGIIKREISEALASSETCHMTLKQYVDNPFDSSTLDFEIPDGIQTNYNAIRTDMYVAGQSMFNLKIDKMRLRLDNTVTDDSMHMQTANLSVHLKPERKVSASNQAYGGREVAIQVPIFLILKDKKIVTCLSTDAETILNALHESCTRLGGSFNDSTKICEDLHGDNGLVLREVREHLCSVGVGDCSKHPYAGFDCRNFKSPTPVVTDKNNWILRGFRADGTPDCACVPVKACENPANHCKGIDLGTDWCFNDCGEGTKEDGICAPCDKTAWAPATDTRCSGENFTQTNGCGETRSAIGTMTDNWMPAASDTCEGETFTQYSSCGASPKYNVAGTKDCSCPALPRPHTWSETISGKTYDCKEKIAAGSTKLKHKGTLSLATDSADENQGTADFECKNGVLTKNEACSSLPKTLECKIFYAYRSHKKTSSTVSQGNWAFVEHGREENCNGPGEYCGMRVGISCKGDDDIRVSYQYKEFNNPTPPKTTPWSTPDGQTRWGDWSQMTVPGHSKEECKNKKCGVVMSVESKKGLGKCDIQYRHRWRHGSSSFARNGTWSEAAYSNGDDDGCQSSSGCGITATISCSI